MNYKNYKTQNRRRYKTRYHTDHNYKTKHSVKQNRAAIIVSIITFLVLACLIVVFVFGDNIYAFLNSSLRHMTDDKPTVSTVETTSPKKKKDKDKKKATESTEATKAEQPADFSALCTAAGIDTDTLNSGQIVFVKCSGTTCTLSTYEATSTGAYQVVDNAISGFISPNGTAQYMTYLDDYTPLGTFDIEFAFGTNPDPGTKLNYLQVSYGSRWITDPNSLNYNKYIDGDAVTIDFTECQNLIEYTRSYPYAVVFSYNRNPVDSSQGCAKFLHVATEPTTFGGVGISQDNLVKILQWLDPEKAPIISIFE